MGYYKYYYTQRGINMNAILDSIGGCGKESILFVTEDSVMVEDNTDTLTGCKCDSCIECGCDPEVCKCGCHKSPFDKTEIFKNKGER